MDTKRRRPLRLLAPVALVVFVVAFFIVVTGSEVQDQNSSQDNAETEEQTDTASTRQRGDKADRREAELPADVYTVKTGDTLAGISQKTGLSVEKLRELNPELDPQALVSGQKIKLRE